MGRYRWHRVRTYNRPSTIRIKPVKYENEFTNTPQYPPILDMSYDACKRREECAWHDKIKALKIVEEKLIEINMPRYYGWRSVMIDENKIPCNSLSFVQHATRTHLRPFEDLPHSVPNEDELNRLVEKIKPQLEEALIFEFKYRSRKHEHKEECLDSLQLEDVITNSVVQQVNRILLSNLSNDTPHLLECQVDYDPRVESFWRVGGMNPPEWKKKKLERNEKLKHKANNPIDRWVQYHGSPALHLRHELPLSAVVDIQESENSDFNVPFFKYDPKTIGYFEDSQHGTNIPGFWPGDASEFGLLSYHRRCHSHKDLKYGEMGKTATLQVQAILASYGWLHSQACYQGFSTFNDVTYPLVTQTVITNGQLWSFYVYQLNTTLLHFEHTSNNSRHNLCWSTAELKLFEEIVDGKVVGLNDDILKYLLKFYLNSPRIREGVEMKPYLGVQEQHIADISEDKRREWLENTFKHMYSNRPRHRLPYEVYDWEKIYKIKHQTRPMEPRRRPFELHHVYPYWRRYDEHVPTYIPKKLREEGKEHIKWRETYYPKV